MATSARHPPSLRLRRLQRPRLRRLTSGSSPTASEHHSAEFSDNRCDDSPGPIPYQRFAEVNRRMKDAEERWQGTEQSWGEILKANPQQYTRDAGLVSAGRSRSGGISGPNPLGATAEPAVSAASRVSQAAKILEMLRHQQPKEDPEPQPDLVAENGCPVMSAQRLREWQGWMQGRQQREFDAKLEQTVAPFKSLVERQQQQELTAASRTSRPTQQLPDGAGSGTGSRNTKRTSPRRSTRTATSTLQDAYLHVLHTKILPAIPAQAQAQVVADLQSKAAAQTLNPSGATQAFGPRLQGGLQGGAGVLRREALAVASNT